MPKHETNIWIVLGAVLLASLVLYFSTQQTLFTDVFQVYFDGTTGMPDNTCIQREGGIGGTSIGCETKHFEIERGGTAPTEVRYDANVGLVSNLDAAEKSQFADATYKVKKNFAGFDINLDLTHQQRQDSTVSVIVSGATCEGEQGIQPIGVGTSGGCVQQGICEARINRDGRVRLSIDSPPTQPLNHFIEFDGKEICKVSATDLGLKIRHSGRLGHMEINSIKFKQPFSCEVPEGWALIEESFEGERNIDLFSLRFFPNFCRNEPPTVLDSLAGGSEPDPRVLDSLVKGETIRVNENQVLVIRYTAPVLDKLDTKCDFAKQVYALKDNQCKPKSGFLQVQTDCTQVLADGTACLSEPNAVFETKELAQQIDCVGVIIPKDDQFVCAIPLPDNVCAEGTLRDDGTCAVYDPAEVKCPVGYEKACLNSECSLFDCRATIEGKQVIQGQAERDEPLNPSEPFVPKKEVSTNKSMIAGVILIFLALVLGWYLFMR